MSNLSDWWTALPVMGWRSSTIDGHACLERPTPPAVLMRMGEGYILHGATEWDLFGEAVEWIEARGGQVGAHSTFPGKNFAVLSDRYHFIGDVVSVPTLPEAAARWLVEHGHHLRDAAKMVKEGSDG